MCLYNVKSYEYIQLPKQLNSVAVDYKRAD